MSHKAWCRIRLEQCWLLTLAVIRSLDQIICGLPISANLQGTTSRLHTCHVLGEQRSTI